MTSSYTFAETFTRAHARKLASRVITDLYQCREIYGEPSSPPIDDYEAELEELLAGGYVSKYQFGFSRDDKLVWSLRYSVGADGGLVPDSRGGGVPHGLDVAGCDFFNSLALSDSWRALSSTARAAIEAKLPFTRATKALPSEAGGFWTRDRGFTAGGVLVEREVFRSVA
jgi:hypothetical protein